MLYSSEILWRFCLSHVLSDLVVNLNAQQIFWCTVFGHLCWQFLKNNKQLKISLWYINCKFFLDFFSPTCIHLLLLCNVTVAPHIKERSLFFPFLSLGWPCDFLWSIEWGGNGVGPVLNLISALILEILSNLRENMPGLACVIMRNKWFHHLLATAYSQPTATQVTEDLPANSAPSHLTH